MPNPSNKVSVVISGGLGNQMFQYASALAIAKYHDADLALDLSWFDIVEGLSNVTHRKYSLGVFGINHPVDGKFYTPQSTTFSGRLKRKFARMFPQLISSRETLNEEKFSFNEHVFETTPPFLLNGYWQSEKYFKDISREIDDLYGRPRSLSSESKSMMENISGVDSICIHIRRGDYVSNSNASQYHGLCPLNYYQQGVSLVSTDLSNPHCFIFSDDINWAKANLKLEIPMTFVDINGPDDAHQDLWLMAACKHFVIANSSLSWWAAYLGKSADKKVVAPKEWFLNKKVDTSDLYLPEWIRI